MSQNSSNIFEAIERAYHKLASTVTLIHTEDGSGSLADTLVQSITPEAGTVSLWCHRHTVRHSTLQRCTDLGSVHHSARAHPSGAYSSTPVRSSLQPRASRLASDSLVTSPLQPSGTPTRTDTECEQCYANTALSISPFHPPPSTLLRGHFTRLYRVHFTVLHTPHSPALGCAVFLSA
jgi:hypothetical protein